MVPRGGIEPPTRGFSIPCSTDCAIEATHQWCVLNVFFDFKSTPILKKCEIINSFARLTNKMYINYTLMRFL